MSALDIGTGVGREPARRAEVLRDMAGRRRSWTLEQKLALVSQMERCGNIAAFARQHDVRTSLLYTWRRELRYALEANRLAEPHAEPAFVPVVAASPRPPPRDVVIEVEVGGAIVRIGHMARGGVGGGCAAGAAGPAMIGPAPGSRVMVATRPVDFRKGADSLAALVAAEYGGKPYSGVIYVFLAKRADRIKLIWWDGTGLCLMAKKLESGAFKWPRIQEGVMRLTAAQLGALLEGLDWRRVHGGRRPVAPQIAA